MRAVGKRRRIIKKRVAAVLNIVELTGKEKCMPNQLSGGEQQRVALARAIVNNPKIILADEPTGNIDPDLSLEIMKMLNIINQSGITVIVVTHEQNLVNYFQKRVITLSGGRIKSDTAREIISDLPDEGDVDDDVIDETIIDETVPAPGELETTPEIQEEQLSGSADIIPGITLSPLDDDSSLYDEDEPETDNEINEDETLDGGDAE